MTNFKIVSHPLIKEKLRFLRDKNTHNIQFRELLSEISYLMTFEITRDLKLKDVEIETPMQKMIAQRIDEHITIVPILRAGLGMLNGILNLLPTSKVGLIGLYRDEKTLEAKEYYCKLPKHVNEHLVLLLDPMLASGHSLDYAINMLKERNVKNIKVVAVVSSPEGVKFLTEKHPDVQFYSAALDEGLNEKGYIMPGLGDCGDRLLGTE